jgi:hypothetical protein
MAPWMYQEQGPIACLLLRKLKPRWWCQFGNAGVYSHPSTRPVEFARKDLPEIYTAHTNVEEQFVVLWGTVNHVVVNDSAHSTAHRTKLGRSGILTWIVDNLIGSYPEDMGTAFQALSPRKIALESQTSFEFHNLPTLEHHSGDNSRSISERGSVHLEWQHDLVQKLHATSSRSTSHWERLISVAPLGDNGICPRCHTACRGG